MGGKTSRPPGSFLVFGAMISKSDPRIVLWDDLEVRGLARGVEADLGVDRQDPAGLSLFQEIRQASGKASWKLLIEREVARLAGGSLRRAYRLWLA